MSIFIIEFNGYTYPVMIHGFNDTGYVVCEYRGQALTERFKELDDAYRFIKKHRVNRGSIKEEEFFNLIKD